MNLLETRPALTRPRVYGIWPRFAAVSASHGVLVGILLTFFTIATTRSGAVDFTQDVAPIFQAHCIQCHGPEKQKSGLRLDSALGIEHGGDEGLVLLAGQPDESRLFQMISGAHETLQMPPKGDRLSEESVAVIRQWIAEGADMPEDLETARVQSDHWAFQPVSRPAVPEAADWGHNDIDRFTLARMNDAGVTPSPEAKKHTQLRRLYLDLLGLPPTPAEVDAYFADPSPNAYEEQVDRLLASPHFGERWGRHWLDLARYADSDGYEKDNARPFAYRYRDWVIQAINEDMPYDQFVVNQLAGDLLPGASLSQKAATGFHRNTLTNREGGIDPEEDRVKQAVDRNNTTGAVFMGLTMACAQCHTHKYDPITQREYFGMYAFFDAALEEDIAAPLPGEEEAHAKAEEKHKAAVIAKKKELSEYKPKLAAGLPAWEASLTIPEMGWDVAKPRSHTSSGGATFKKLDDESLLLSGDNPIADTYTVVLKTDASAIRGIRLETLKHKGLNYGGPGRAHNGNFVLGEFSVTAAPANAPHDTTPLQITSATASFAQKGYPIESAFDGDPNTGWAIFNGRDTNKDCVANFTLSEPVGFDKGTILTFKLAHYYGNQHTIGRFRLSLTGNDPANILYPDEVVAALLTPSSERAPAEVDALLHAYGQQDEHYKKLTESLNKLENSPPAPVKSILMALKENDSPPVTRIHNRGDFLQPGAKVAPHTPAVLHPMHVRGERPDRLDLARWIAQPENPLTARVAVNRVWEHLFGEGLARTSDDFGTRTEPPTHPELLDWLATSFVVDDGWSTKTLIRKIVTSATYRQSSYVRRDLAEMDPTNRLLARQNRFRVEAEITRDLFLAASGLLETSVGGPSVRPPVPDGVMNLGYANSIKWKESEGTDRYRRGLYIFFQRTVAYPMLMTFDCPDSNVSSLSRNRSNTPLQSLTLLNDPVFVEAAQALGKDLLTAGPEELSARVESAFKRCMGRAPKPAEVESLVALVKAQEAQFGPIPEEAKALAGPYLPENVPPATAAAHIVLARAIMNLDEFVTRE
jgi:mono/diheme cytochrome c family protein